MKTTWDFVETHYPDYHRSEVITLSNDLVKILNGEYEDGDSSHTMLVNEYHNNPKNPQILTDYYDTMRIIYERSIDNYIKTK